ncbi:MAG: helix-turn-helix domain-containing protein [Candidatus Caldarchaeum sp.]
MRDRAGEAVELLQSSLGLNRYQARAYLAVVMGCRKAKDVAGRAGIPITRVYDTLQSLAEMGLVMKTEKGYRPLEPSHALTNLFQREQRALEKHLEARRRGLERLVGLMSFYMKTEEDEADTALLKGLEPVVVKTMEVCGRGSTLVFAVRKAVKLKQIFREAVEKNRSKNIVFIVHSSVTLNGEDREFFTKLGARVVQSPAVLVDMLVSDAGEALVGLPLDDEPVVVWVRHRGFAGSLLQALLESF